MFFFVRRRNGKTKNLCCRNTVVAMQKERQIGNWNGKCWFVETWRLALKGLFVIFECSVVHGDILLISPWSTWRDFPSEDPNSLNL